MSFTKRGGLTALLAVLAIGLAVVALIPSIFWVQTSTGGEKVEISLWQTCATVDGGPKICSKIDGFHKDDIKTEKTAERDGAVAGLVLGGLFAVIGLVTTCCKKKCGTVTLNVLAAVCMAATVGCFYRYKTHSLDTDEYTLKYTVGFFLACGAFAMSLLASITSCCINNEQADYFNIA